MKKKQKAVCWIAGIIFLLSLLNASWIQTRFGTLTVSASSPIWDAPFNSTLAVDQLVFEWIGIAVFSGILILVFKSSKK